jgi:hypothetical protein
MDAFDRQCRAAAINRLLIKRDVRSAVFEMVAQPAFFTFFNDPAISAEPD